MINTYSISRIYLNQLTYKEELQKGLGPKRPRIYDMKVVFGRFISSPVGSGDPT